MIQKMYVIIFCCGLTFNLVFSMWRRSVCCVPAHGPRYHEVYLTAGGPWNVFVVKEYVPKSNMSQNTHWKHKMKCIRIKNEVKTINTMNYEEQLRKNMK